MRTVVLFVGLVALPGIVTAANDNLRVATFNINWGNVNLPDIERALRESNADVVFIQESTPRSEAFFRNRLIDRYKYQSFRGFRGRYKAERSGFLSKKPLSEITFVPPAGGLFGTYFATIEHSGQKLRLANVHLSPFMIRRGSGFRQALRDISTVEATHEKEIARLVENIDPRMPTLVCGDFNSLSTFAAPRQLRDLGLTDSFAMLNENADTHPTWKWPVGTTRIQFRIDYIFHSNHFRTEASRIVQTSGSDHSLVVSDIAFEKSSD